MDRKVLILIIILMCTSLLGIITVNVLWVKSSVEIRDTQFSNDVKNALAKVSENTRNKEFNEYFDKIYNSKHLDIKPHKSNLKEFYYKEIDSGKNQTFTYTQRILEGNYKIPLEFFENDSIVLKKIYNKESIEVSGEYEENGKPNNHSEKDFEQIVRMDKVEKEAFKKVISTLLNRKPIYQRVTNQELNESIKHQLEIRNVNTSFKYGIYNNGLATKLRSPYYRVTYSDKTYMVPFFSNDSEENDYRLYVSFPKKNRFIFKSMTNLLFISFLFILITFLTFSVSLYHLLKQKQISEIKTDFINNMTHEFKTPIATINLALDSIKNPKIINNKVSIKRYVNMIREENRRMHEQVENVLRISRLEKNQLDLSKVEVDMRDIVDEATAHVELIIEKRKGYLNKHYNATITEVLGNQFHLTNVLVNILDNAVKYSLNKPRIDILTENTSKHYIIEVKDRGIGISKNNQKHVFDKFYRAQTGNIHDVKGHGLGLAYVKKIIENHQGHVYLESEAGKGSTFIIELPLI